MSEREAADILGQAIAAWREADAGNASDEKLAPERHLRILRAVRPGAGCSAALRPQFWLFFPALRFAVAGVIPVVALTLAIGYLGLGRSGPAPAKDAPATAVRVSKDKDSVVFVIANGSPVHRVYTSESPARFAPSPAFTTRDGSFQDRLDSGGDLVFYRID